MNWLSDDCVISTEDLAVCEYPYFSGVFGELVDVPYLHTVLSDDTMITEYEFVDTEDENGEIVTTRVEKYRDGELQQHPLFPVAQKNEVMKILRNLNGNINEVSYSGRSKDRTNIGRRFANYCGTNEDGTPKMVYEGQHANPSLTTVTKNIRNTLFHKLGLTDFDFAASHFTICKELGKRLRIRTPRINEWVADKDPVVAKLSKHHSVGGHEPLDKGDIKKLISAALFGGGLDTWAYGAKIKDAENVWDGHSRKKGGITNGDADWNVFPKSVKNTGKDYDDRNKWRDEHKWYREFKKELKTLKETLWGRNQEFANAVVPDEKEGEFARQGSFFSYYLGAIENECLHIAQEYMVENCMMERNTSPLAYDGFTGFLKEGFDASVVAAECSELIVSRTGFPMKMIKKEFDESTIQHAVLTRSEELGDAAIRPLVEEASWVNLPRTPPAISRRTQSLPNPPAAGAGNDDLPDLPDLPDIPDLNRRATTPAEATNLTEWFAATTHRSSVYNNPEYIRWKREFEYGDRFDERHLMIKQFSGYIYFTHDDDGNVKLMEKSKSELRNMYENSTIQVETTTPTGRPRVEEKSCLELWFKDPEKRTYTRMTALPHGTRVCKADTFNSYIPSRFYQKHISKEECNVYGDPRWDDRAVKYFLRHIKIICNNEPEPADFLLKWICSFIQNPQRKGAHIIITGQTGTGKNSLTEVLKELVGGNTLETTDPKRDCWGDFNLLMAGANLVILNEISQEDAFKAEGKIKGLVTDKKLTINGKGSNQFQIESFHRFITLSNKDEPLKTSKQDRRQMITEMSPELREQEKFWDYWYNKQVGMLSENALLSVYSYLWNFDIGDFNPLPPPNKLPLTQHHRELLEYKPPLERFLLHFVTKMLHEREDVLEMNEVSRFRNPTRITAQMMERQEHKGFIALTGGEFWNEFELWRREGNGNRCDLRDAAGLTKKIKNTVIRDTYGNSASSNDYKEKVCPTQTRTGTNYEDTYWNIYELRDFYIKEGDFIPDGNTIVLGALHPSLHHATNADLLNRVASFNPPVAGAGLQDMNGLGDALDEYAEEYTGEAYEPEYEDNQMGTPTANRTPLQEDTRTLRERMATPTITLNVTPPAATPPSNVTTGESSSGNDDTPDDDPAKIRDRERMELARRIAEAGNRPASNQNAVANPENAYGGVWNSPTR